MAPKLCKFIRFGDIHAPKPYKFIGFTEALSKSHENPKLKPIKTLVLALLKAIFDFDFGPLPPGGPGAGSGRPFSYGDRCFWADSGPTPGGNLIFNFDFGPKRSWVVKPYQNPMKTRIETY